MMEKQETFEQYLERCLINAGLRSYGENEFDQEAELMCYQRAVDCFNPTDSKDARIGPKDKFCFGSKYSRDGPGLYLNGAPRPANEPPWGIHTIDLEDAPHEALLADDGPPSEYTNSTDFQKALDLAANVVEKEALLFDGEAIEIMPSENEGPSNRKEWEKFLIARGRVHSLRRLSKEIRNIKQ